MTLIALIVLDLCVSKHEQVVRYGLTFSFAVLILPQASRGTGVLTPTPGLRFDSLRASNTGMQRHGGRVGTLSFFQILPVRN
jgi:hypothetical protein